MAGLVAHNADGVPFAKFPRVRAEPAPSGCSVRNVSQNETQRPRRAHAVIVFGCPARRNGHVGPALRRRLERGLEVAQADTEAVVIVSGGDMAGPAEAPIMRAWLVANGLPPERIVVEDRARSTIENALFVAPMLRKLSVDRVTLVTSRFHAQRATVLLRLALRRSDLARVHVDTLPAAVGPSDGKWATAGLEAVKLACNLVLFPFWAGR